MLNKKLFLTLFFVLLTLPFFSQESKAPVAPFGDELFFIHGDSGSITAQMRADAVEKNIAALHRELTFNPELLVIEHKADIDNILYKNKIITGIIDAQAKAEGYSREDYAAYVKNAILSAVEFERNKNQTAFLLRELGVGAVIILAVLIFIFFLHKCDCKVREIVIKKQNKHAAINNIVDLHTQKHIAFVISKVVKVVLGITAVCAGFIGLMNLFPKTRHTAHVVIGSLAAPVHKGFSAFVNYIPDLLDIIFILAVFFILTKMCRNLAQKISSGKIKITNFHPDWAIPTYRILLVIFLVFTFIFVFPHLPNSDSAGFKGISVFLGVLLSLGSTSIISNMVSGLVITYMRPFKVGEVVKMGEVTGAVVEKNALVTRILTSKNEIITIPNSNIMTAHTVNYTTSAKERGLILHTSVVVDYNVEWKKVYEMLTEAALKTPNTLKTSAPYVRQMELQESGAKYEINVFTDNVDKVPLIYTNLHENIQDVFNEAGIELMNTDTLAIRDGNESDLPKKYQKKP